MARDAVACIQELDALRVAGVGELPLGVRVVGGLELRTVAALAGRLQRLAIGEGLRVTALTRKLDLVVPVARGAG
jgi:hypothetical protein